MLRDATHSSQAGGILGKQVSLCLCGGRVGVFGSLMSVPRGALTLWPLYSSTSKAFTVMTASRSLLLSFHAAGVTAVMRFPFLCVCSGQKYPLIIADMFNNHQNSKSIKSLCLPAWCWMTTTKRQKSVYTHVKTTAIKAINP